MANQANDEISIRPSRMRERVPLFRVIGRVDDALYAVARVLVTAFLVIMTLASFLKILADFLGKSDTVAIYPFIFFAFFIIGRVSSGSSPRWEGQRTRQNLVAVGWGLIASAYVWFVHASTLTLTTLERRHGGELTPWSYDWIVGTISSSAVVIFRVSVTMVLILYYHVQDWRKVYAQSGARSRVAAVLTTFVVWAVIIYMSLKLGAGYSWGPQISLLLLLCTAFMGASMANHARKHLTIDAVRKIVPTRFERAFNALSFMLTAIVTAAFFLLSYHYLLKRMGDAPEPGTIPDWIKVASIPVAFGMITVRFACYAVAEAVGAFLKVEPEPAPDLLEVS